MEVADFVLLGCDFIFVIKSQLIAWQELGQVLRVDHFLLKLPKDYVAADGASELHHHCAEDQSYVQDARHDGSVYTKV